MTDEIRNIAMRGALAAQRYSGGRSDAALEKLRAFSALKSGAADPSAKDSQALKSAETKKAATDFEALLLTEMLKEMWKTVPDKGMLDSGNEMGIYRDMFSENLAQHIAENNSIGVRDVIVKDIDKLQKK